jgi:hypothetical protein
LEANGPAGGKVDAAAELEANGPAGGKVDASAESRQERNAHVSRKKKNEKKLPAVFSTALDLAEAIK